MVSGSDFPYQFIDQPIQGWMKRNCHLGNPRLWRCSATISISRSMQRCLRRVEGGPQVANSVAVAGPRNGGPCCRPGNLVPNDCRPLVLNGFKIGLQFWDESWCLPAGVAYSNHVHPWSLLHGLGPSWLAREVLLSGSEQYGALNPSISHQFS